MIEAAGSTPSRTPPASLFDPFRHERVEIGVLKCGAATATKIASAMIFTPTRMALTVALSRAPTVSIAVTNAMIAMAGTLTTPPAQRPAESAAGRWTPRPFRKPTA